MRLRYQDVIHKFLHKFNPKSKTSGFSWYCWKQEKAETKLWLLCELEFYGSCRLKIKCKRRKSPQSVLKLWILGMDGEGGIKAQQSVSIKRCSGALRSSWIPHSLCGRRECVCVFCLFVCCMSAPGCPELHCCCDLERVLWQQVPHWIQKAAALVPYWINSAVSSPWEFLAEPIREGVVKARIVVAVFYQARMLWEKLED